MSKYVCPKCNERHLTRDGFTPGGAQRWACRTIVNGTRTVCYKTTDPTAPYRDQGAAARKPDERPRFHRKLERQTFVITCAQNATPVHEGFLSALETYCAEHDAELIVVPLRYKNPTSRWTASQQNAERWAREVEPYLYNQRKKLNDNLTLLGDHKIQPTAVRPLSSLEGHTHAESSIIGHPKLQMTTVPTPQNKLPKIMTTTGAVTVKNYTDSRAGKGGEFHHVYGAVVVEIESRSTFHLRHVNARQDGAFIDLDQEYHPGGTVRKAPPAPAIVFGDAHYRFADPQVVQATFGPGGLVERLNPEALVWHDLLDAYAVNPHHIYNPFIGIAKHDAGFDDIETEVAETVAWLAEMTGERQSYVVASNHDDMLSRWIMREDWKRDPRNAVFYLETALHMAKSAKMGEGGANYIDPFGYWIQQRAPADARIKPLTRSESLMIAGIECSLHGDRGPHGMKGSRMNLRRIGARTIIGHCLTADHDVLVRGRGWTPIADVPAGEALLAYEGGRNVWTVAPEKQEYMFTGRLLRIRHVGAFDQEVTPGHYLVLHESGYTRVTDAVLTAPASALPVAAAPEAGGTLVVPHDELRKVVAAAADGSFYSRSLAFNLKKPRKHERLQELFGADLLPPGRPRANGALRRTVAMRSPSYASITKWMEPTAEGKGIPAAFLELTPECRQVVLDELRHWDGTFKTGGNGQQYSTFREHEARVVAALVTLHGYRCTFAKRPDSRGYVISWNENRAHSFVSAKGHDQARWRQWGLSTRAVVEEPTYCFTTESGCFWVRSQRTGLVSLTGNSHAPGIEEGAYQTGTMSRLNLEYNDGPSAWMNAHCSIDAFGKRHLHLIVNGAYTTRK